MEGLRTRGQPVAAAAVRAMLASGFPHALLLVGPAGVGKTTLALDIAAALLCQGAPGSARPCRACRGCRTVEHGNHPDLHRLAPAGSGALISIGGREERGVRELVHDLAFLPVEGGARVAIIEAAHRMTEDAQSAFLKTLEEPPPGTTIVLCADDEERLLPTIRSRVVRVRLGPMGSRDVEAVLVEQGIADPPTAARLSRITDGRPGHAIALARAPQAVILRGEIARTLLDLLDASVTARLTGLRDLAARSGEMLRAIETGATQAAGSGRAARPSHGRGRAAQADPPRAMPSPPEAADVSGDELDLAVEERSTRAPAAERRRAALALLEVWRAVVRDMGLVVVGEAGTVRDQDLLDDLNGPARRLDVAAIGSTLRRLDVAAEQLEGNVSPELVLDVLAIRWAASHAA
ncbi:MAG: AAA family ATPase [Chloroflexi bacterium]|nr:AAA family ATPase [Chloroflexota bacterium]